MRIKFFFYALTFYIPLHRHHAKPSYVSVHMCSFNNKIASQTNLLWFVHIRIDIPLSNFIVVIAATSNIEDVSIVSSLAYDPMDFFYP